MAITKLEPKYINDVIKCYDGLAMGTKTATIAKNVGVNPAFVTYVSCIANDIQKYGYDMATAKLPADAIVRQRILKLLANGMSDKQIAVLIPETKLNYIRLVQKIYEVVHRICVLPSDKSQIELTQPDRKGSLNYSKANNKVVIRETSKLHRTNQDKDSLLNEAPEYLSISDFLKDEEQQIEQAKTISKAKRKAILQKSNPKPRKAFVKQSVFIRNPYVVVEVLERANGVCERCGNPAPFLRDNDNSPFLEVHHVVPLAEGGNDTVSNAIGLCPNCHRHAHYGKNSY